MNEPKNEMKALVDELLEARRTSYRLRFDEESPDRLGEPCSSAQIAVLERHLGKPLPPSYRTFLELHNGWSHFDGDAKLLSVEDQKSEWVRERIGDFTELFDEDGTAKNPFKAGAIPIMMGEHESNYVVLDPRKPRPDGEMTFASYDLTEREQRFKDFFEYLRNKLKLTRRIIEMCESGELSDDEDEND